MAATPHGGAEAKYHRISSRRIEEWHGIAMCYLLMSNIPEGMWYDGLPSPPRETGAHFGTSWKQFS
jgi:hypothetical protein